MAKQHVFNFIFRTKWKDTYFEAKFSYIVILIILLFTCVLWFRFEKYITTEYCDFDNDFGKLYRTIYASRVRYIIERAANASSYDTTKTNSKKWITKLCPEILASYMSTSQSDVANSVQYPQVANEDDITSGGSWYPRDCVARHHVAVIIPYRDRLAHLQNLLLTLIPTLKRQRLHFQIYVVEQYGQGMFNKGVLYNAAFIEALVDNDWQCFVFHDVDLVSENNLTMYTCPGYPRHLSVAIDEMNYRLKYDHLVGGVLNVRREHFQRINGYSNLYWGWGAEDDDLAKRMKAAGLRVDRPPYNIARFKMYRHKKRKHAPWKTRLGQLYLAHLRFHTDGLNSVQYQLVSRTLMPQYTHLMLDVGSPPEREPTMREQYARALETNSRRKKKC